MRIAIDIKAFKNGSTGIARYLRSIMDCLQEIDHENDYFLFECRLSSYAPSSPKWKKILIPWKLPGILWQQFALPFHLRKHRIDVLWAGEQVCPLIFMGNIRVVTTIFDLAFLYYPESFQLPNLLIQRFLTPLVLRRSDTLITISDFIRRDVLKNYKIRGLEQKTFAIPCGKPDWVLPADYLPTNRKEFLFFAGNNEPRKNLLNLLRAIEILYHQGKKIELHLAGPAGWKNKNIREFLENSPIKGQVKFLGYLSEDELKDEYLSCKALVYPSLYEGFGLPILEALLLDCPVLTSKGTVMEEVAKDCATYFDANSPADIAAKMGLILEPDAITRKRQSEKPAHWKSYSWAATARQTLMILLDASRASPS